MFPANDIIKALSTVEDPDLKRDLVSLNMIKDIVVDSGMRKFYSGSDHPCLPAKGKNQAGL